MDDTFDAIFKYMFIKIDKKTKSFVSQFLSKLITVYNGL